MRQVDAAESLPEIVRAAWDEGQKIDLSGIGYGRLHWGNKQDVRDEPSPYYYFLAGMVRMFDLRRVLEIGTHWGGATRAMWHGLPSDVGATFVTVDITEESDNRLADYPKITKIVGDGNSEDAFLSVIDEFSDRRADLVYVDAAHQTMPTFTSFCLYALALKPKFMIFDDITLNDGMRDAWKLIQKAVPSDDSVNAAEVVRAIRPSPDNPGFGVVRFRSN